MLENDTLTCGDVQESGQSSVLRELLLVAAVVLAVNACFLSTSLVV
jgi:hypothetical protein